MKNVDGFGTQVNFERSILIDRDNLNDRLNASHPIDPLEGEFCRNQDILGSEYMQNGDLRLNGDASRPAGEDDQGDSEEIELHEGVWNVNMFSVLSWKNAHQAVIKRGRTVRKKKNPIKKFVASLPAYIFRIIPFVIACIEVLILIGILDQGAKIKTLIDHDSIFRKPFFKWAKSSSICDPNNLMKGWLQAQNRLEAYNCVQYRRQMISHTLRSKFSDDDFFDEYYESTQGNFSTDMEWILSHCFPWAYSDVCINIMSSGADLDRPGRGGCDQPDGVGACSYRNCYLPTDLSSGFGGSNRITRQMWQGVAVPLDEVENLINLSQPIADTSDIQQNDIYVMRFLEAYEASETNRVYANNSEFICWFMQSMLNKRKTYNSGPNDLSFYLYERLHFVYRLGVGDSHMLEMITIIVLSLYVYFTAIFDELAQMFYQVYAFTELSSPGDILRSLGQTNSNSEIEIERSWTSKIRRYLYLSFHNMMCEVFLSLRMIYVACMCQATVMIMAWDHGVMEVVFASLAITFLLEVDDQLMGTLCEKLEFSKSHRKTVEAFKAVLRERILCNEGRTGTIQHASRAKIIRVAAFVLLVALAALHLVQTLTLATMVGLRSADDNKEAQNVLDFFVVLQRRFLPLSAGIAGAAMACNLCIQGPYSIVNSVGLGLCLAWVMEVVYIGLNNGVLYDLWNMYEDGQPAMGPDDVARSALLRMADGGVSWGLMAFLPLHFCWALATPMAVAYLCPDKGARPALLAHKAH